MRTLSTILTVFILLALCAGECVAQSTSSASQTITFGVRRIAAPSLAANFSQVRANDESAALNPVPLKVTLGSDVRSEELMIGTRVSAVKKVRQQRMIDSDQIVVLAESPSPFRAATPKSVVTVTE